MPTLEVHLLLLFCVATTSGDHVSPQIVQRPLRPPPVVTSLNDYVEGNDECLRTSYYYRPQDEFVCKNLGKCYQHHCRNIARRCGSCAGGNGPCIKYDFSDITNHHNGLNTARKSKRLVRSRRRSSRAWNKVFKLYGKGSGNRRRSAESEERPPVYIENIGNAIVHLNSGDTNCTGFVTSLVQEERSYVIMTAAQCLVQYDVACEDTYEWRLEDRSFNDSIACFNDQDLDVNKVIKQFRSYVVSVVSYSGKRYTLPLNTATTYIPRNFLECDDCKYDVAAIKIDTEVANDILGRSSAFSITDEEKSTLMTSPVAMITVSKEFPSNLLRRATRIKYCMINHATKQRMCIQIPVLSAEAADENYLPGSPVFMIPSSEDDSIKVVGIYTGFDSVTNNSFPIKLLNSQTHLADGILNETSQINSAVRINTQLKTSVETFASKSRKLNAIMKSARHDCFPSPSKPLTKSNLLCLCSRGWRDEMTDCKRFDEARIPEGCSFDHESLRFWCDRNPARDNSQLIFKNAIIPGNTAVLDLRFQNIENDVEIAEVLRHLQLTTRVILEYNAMQTLSNDIFENNGHMEMLSLKNNKLTTISSDTLRTNYNITSVSLANNLLEEIPKDLFKENRKLRQLNLQGNKLRSLDEETFEKNTLLARIILRHNQLLSLPSRLFYHNTKLREIWLDHNQLTTIPESLLRNCNELILINLSFNQLTVIQPQTFQGCNSLQYVDFNYNRITELNANLFHNITTIKSVTTLGNPIM